MIKHCLDADGDPNPKAISKYNILLDDYVGELQASDLAPGTINGHIKAIKALFRCNKVRLESPYGLSNKVVNKDRSPTVEELNKLLDVANIREKLIECMLALGGFREGTLTKLRYRHVKHDLEAGIVPLHIHVEASITKGKYNDYDTFLGQEAVDFLKIYLDIRRRGTNKIPPEVITDDSPLIRSETSRIPRFISTTTVYKILHKLFIKAGITLKKIGTRYDVRVHSIRKFFRTQLAALGVQADYIEYMMGHQISTYHDIQMKGVDFLRNIYRAAALCIRAKLRINKMDALKELIRAWGMNPEEILAKDAMTKSNATVMGSDQLLDQQIQRLSSALREQVLKDLKGEQNGQ
jgi:site-specific recombinase XerD